MMVESSPEAASSLGSANLRIVVVDDHQLVRDGVKHLLDLHADLEVVGEAASVEEAVRRVAYEDPDVVVLDVDLPDGSGIEACRRIRALCNGTKVLMLTAFADAQALDSAREAGASGFVLKRIRDMDLVSSIRKVARGELAFDGAPSAVDQPDLILERLTDREETILELIAEGLTNREIADRLFLAEKTVKNYVSNLLTKMGISHRAGAAAYFARARSAAERPYPPAQWPDGAKR